MKTILSQNGTVISQEFASLEEEQSLIIENIKRTAEEKIISLEGKPAAFKLKRAKELDEIDGGYRYQALTRKIDVIRKRSNDLEAEILQINNPKAVAEFDYFTPMNAAVELDDIPTLLTVEQFQMLMVTAFGSGGDTKYGSLMMIAETLMKTQPAIRFVMDRYNKAATVDRETAKQLLKTLIDAGVDAVNQTDLDNVMAAWPVLRTQ